MLYPKYRGKQCGVKCFWDWGLKPHWELGQQTHAVSVHRSVRFSVSRREQGGGMTTGAPCWNTKSKLSCSHLRVSSQACSSAVTSHCTSGDVSSDCSLQWPWAKSLSQLTIKTGSRYTVICVLGRWCPVESARLDDRMVVAGISFVTIWKIIQPMFFSAVDNGHSLGQPLLTVSSSRSSLEHSWGACCCDGGGGKGSDSFTVLPPGPADLPCWWSIPGVLAALLFMLFTLYSVLSTFAGAFSKAAWRYRKEIT